MSIGTIRGKVGALSIEFSAPPRGISGDLEARVRGADGGAQTVQSVKIRWRRDAYGLWLETERGCFGFDVTPIENLDGDSDRGGLRTVNVVSRTKGGVELGGLRFVREGEDAVGAAGASSRKRSVKVRAQMPGKIVRVLVGVGSVIKKGQSLLTMEAMKMENEIRASQDGVVAQVLVAEQQAVESGADLLILE